MGGSRLPSTDSAANLVVLCGSGTSGCHGWVESHRTEALGLGWLIRQGQDPEAIPVPVKLAGGRFVLLDSAGGWTDGAFASRPALP